MSNDSSQWHTSPETDTVHANYAVAAAQVDLTAHPPPDLVVHPG